MCRAFVLAASRFAGVDGAEILAQLVRKTGYLYLDFGSKTFFAGTANQADVSFHIFRAGFNYAFNAPPVAAKY
jgi:opacity protein-like surface antigen